VAVKFFDGASDNFAAWISEMRLALRLHHAHIVQCLDVGHDAQHDLCVLVFARAMGGSLRRALASGAGLTDPQIHRMLVELAAALAHAHAGRVVHCDVKPENILALERLGEPPWALTDFGTGSFLVDGAVLPGPVGSPPYMSPESLLGGTQRGQRSVLARRRRPRAALGRARAAGRALGVSPAAPPTQRAAGDRRAAPRSGSGGPVRQLRVLEGWC
jgi:serine/threonine protein kinase